MKLSAEATQFNELIDIKYTRIRILIEEGDFFNAGCTYYSLELVRDDILESYEIGNIEKWEKELLLDNLTYSMVRIIDLVRNKKGR